MRSSGNLKSVSLVINPLTFVELQIKSDKLRLNLEELYIRSIKDYLKDCTPDRLTVFAAPGAGKRIRVNIPEDIYHQLSLKIGTSGFNVNDVVYTALECLLDPKLKSIAA